MLYLISYDVTVDKRRTAVMKLLEGYGRRVQYSVFECELTPPQYARIGSVLRTLVDGRTDSVRCYALDATAVARIAIVGRGTVTKDPPYYLV